MISGHAHFTVDQPQHSCGQHSKHPQSLFSDFVRLYLKRHESGLRINLEADDKPKLWKMFLTGNFFTEANL